MAKRNGRMKRIDDSLYDLIQKVKFEKHCGDVEASRIVAKKLKQKGRKITVDDLFDF